MLTRAMRADRCAAHDSTIATPPPMPSMSVRMPKGKSRSNDAGDGRGEAGGGDGGEGRRDVTPGGTHGGW